MLKNETENSLLSRIKAYLIHLLLFLIISFALLVSVSAILFNSDDPTKFTEVGGKIILFISSLLSGFILSKRLKEQWLVNGLMLGALITVTVLLLSLFVLKSQENNIVWYLLITASTVFGSLLGNKKRTGKKRRHK